jgi:glycosyltransferase involved in cell wall biosynthesis
VVTCDDLAQDFCHRHPALSRAIFDTITNGWDASDFRTTAPRRISIPTFALTYVGAFYRDQSIEPFLEAFRRLLARRSDLRHRLRFEHVGTLSREQTQLLRPTDDEFLVRRGYADHHAAITAMRDADALLLTVPPTPGGRLCIPAKTFEYLATDRPILAFAQPDSHLARLLTRAGGVTPLPNCRPDTIAAAIETLAATPAADRPQIRRCQTVLRETSRVFLAARYARLLDQVTGLSQPIHARRPAQYWQTPRATA